MQISTMRSWVAILALAITIPNAYAVKHGEKFKDWTGKCETIENKTFCGVSQTIFDKEKRPVVNIFIQKMADDPVPLVFVTVPLRVNLRAGLGVAVDRKEVALVPYSICDPAGCNAVVKLTSELEEKLKKGNKLQVAMLYGQREIIYSASLSGISKALSAL